MDRRKEGKKQNWPTKAKVTTTAIADTFTNSFSIYSLVTAQNCTEPERIEPNRTEPNRIEKRKRQRQLECLDGKTREQATEIRASSNQTVVRIRFRIKSVVWCVCLCVGWDVRVLARVTQSIFTKWKRFKIHTKHTHTPKQCICTFPGRSWILHFKTIHFAYTLNVHIEMSQSFCRIHSIPLVSREPCEPHGMAYDTSLVDIFFPLCILPPPPAWWMCACVYDNRTNLFLSYLFVHTKRKMLLSVLRHSLTASFLTHSLSLALGTKLSCLKIK